MVADICVFFLLAVAVAMLIGMLGLVVWDLRPGGLLNRRPKVHVDIARLERELLDDPRSYAEQIEDPLATRKILEDVRRMRNAQHELIADRSTWDENMAQLKAYAKALDK